MNKFEQYLQGCIGKTIAKAELGNVGDIDSDNDAVRIVFTDDTTLTLYLDADDVQLCIQEIQYCPTGRDKFSVSYSALRGEVYVIDEESGMQVFTIPEDEIEGGAIPIVLMTNDQLFKRVLDTHYSVLEDYNLV